MRLSNNIRVHWPEEYRLDSLMTFVKIRRVDSHRKLHQKNSDETNFKSFVSDFLIESPTSADNYVHSISI